MPKRTTSAPTTQQSTPTCPLCSQPSSATLRTINLMTLTGLPDYRFNINTPMTVCLNCAKRIGTAMEKEVLKIAKESGTEESVKRFNLG